MTPEISRPTWMTNDLFKEVLEQSADCEIQLYNVKVEHQLNEEDAPLSGFYRVTLKYTQGEQLGFRFRRFVVKALPENCDESKLESHCNSTIIPRVHALLQSIGDFTKLTPKTFHYNGESGDQFVIFEDLKERAFRTCDPKVGLDAPHLELIMKNLAKWHGVTAYLSTIDPTLFTEYKERPVIISDTTFADSMKNFGESVKMWPGFERYYEKLKKLPKTIEGKLSKTFDREDSGFNCLNHCGLEMDNIAFKYNTKGQPEEVNFTNFSRGYFGSPGFDLVFVLLSTNDGNQGEDQWMDYLRVYHDEFVRVLSKLGYKKQIPGFLDIYIAFLKKAHFALGFLPQTIQHRFNADKNKLIGGDESEKDVQKKKVPEDLKIRTVLEPVLKFCFNKGLLDA